MYITGIAHCIIFNTLPNVFGWNSPGEIQNQKLSSLYPQSSDVRCPVIIMLVPTYVKMVNTVAGKAAARECPSSANDDPL